MRLAMLSVLLLFIAVCICAMVGTGIYEIELVNSQSKALADAMSQFFFAATFLSLVLLFTIAAGCAYLFHFALEWGRQ